jgi:hypothetical protein
VFDISFLLTRNFYKVMIVLKTDSYFPYTFLGWISLIFFFSCSKDDFNIGSEFVESKSSISIIDTFNVELSTVLFDSIETSGDTTILIGNHSDTMLGKISCNSAFEVTIPSEKDFEINDVFDSLCLILLPNDYYFGDTLQRHSFSVHRLLSDLETYSDGYLYNTTQVSFQTEALGNYEWFPRPNHTDSIFILLDDSFGQELFDIYMGDDEFTTAIEFLEYFKGFYIQSDTLNTNSVIGFNASSAVMRMYYHRYGEQKEDLAVDFQLNNTDEQFNQIATDFSKSNFLSGINSENNVLKATQTRNLAFMQLGSGLTQKILFPSLNEFLLFEATALLKAELVIYPEKTSYQDFLLPEELVLYKTDKYNNFLEVVYDEDGNTVYSSLTKDELYYENTSYTFDITQYINDQIDNKYFDPNNGLLVFSGTGNLSSTLERLIISSNASSPKLKLYCVNYTE